MISALVFIDYSEKADEIIVKADESDSKWEDTLSQMKKEMKKRHSIYYKSKLWSDTEKKYDIMKWKYHAVLKMLKKY